MSGQPAARIGDMLACATPQATPAALPHAPAGMPISAVGAPTVFIGNQIAARMTDFSLCPSPVPVPNLISRGAFPVPIMNLPAARMTDMGTAPHTGVILPPCCPTVLIGLAGTAGNIMAGTAACNAAAAGRTSNTTSQTYNNCGVESSRQLINRGNAGGISENALLQQSINSGLASGTPGSPPVFANGGTGAAGRQSILAANGVPSNIQATTTTNMGLNAAAGRGMIVNLDAAPLWGGTTPAGSLHAVVVTGVVYDDAGNVTDVVINDTGTGQCGQTVPIATFNAATAAHPNTQLNVTNAQIW
ncbi:MAG: PAAR domain-containing protein [Phycisphaerales bacterium]|nr:PAAR domain-containing protein [Phycisphaerales bacterium]